MCSSTGSNPLDTSMSFWHLLQREQQKRNNTSTMCLFYSLSFIEAQENSLSYKEHHSDSSYSNASPSYGLVHIPATYIKLSVLSKLTEINRDKTHCSCFKAHKNFGVLSVISPLFSALQPCCQKQSPGYTGHLAFQGDMKGTINCYPTQLSLKSDLDKDAKFHWSQGACAY